jgi:hypothetical protein
MVSKHFLITITITVFLALTAAFLVPYLIQKRLRHSELSKQGSIALKVAECAPQYNISDGEIDHTQIIHIAGEERLNKLDILTPDRTIVDVWNNRVVFKKSGDYILCISSGPDGIMGNNDDIEEKFRIDE